MTDCVGRYLKIGRDITYGDGAFDEVQVSDIDLSSLCDLRELTTDNEALKWVTNTDQLPGPVLSITPKSNPTSPGCYRLRLPGPLVFATPPLHTTGYWGDMRPYLVREFATDGFGTRCGYPSARPEWLLENGGILGTSMNDPVSFTLMRDGWRIANSG